MNKITKRQAQKFLGNVPEQYVFYCHNGNHIWNMESLLNELGNMTDETFSYHVNQEKNDFSNWVRDIIEDVKLAKDIAKIKNRQEAIKVVNERISLLKSSAG